MVLNMNPNLIGMSVGIFLSFLMVFVISIFSCHFFPRGEKYNFKSIIIYKKALLSHKHFISKWFKNTVEYPKFKLNIVYLFITILTDIAMYILIFFFHNSKIFLNIWIGYLIYKLIQIIINESILVALDNKYFEEELAMSQDELENVLKEIEEAHPGFFDEWID